MSDTDSALPDSATAGILASALDKRACSLAEVVGWADRAISQRVEPPPMWLIDVSLAPDVDAVLRALRTGSIDAEVWDGPTPSVYLLAEALRRQQIDVERAISRAFLTIVYDTDAPLWLRDRLYELDEWLHRGTADSTLRSELLALQRLLVEESAVVREVEAVLQRCR
jgi:hypothetical protein